MSTQNGPSTLQLLSLERLKGRNPIEAYVGEITFMYYVVLDDIYSRTASLI